MQLFETNCPTNIQLQFSIFFQYSFQILGLFIITCCCDQKALSFTYRRTGNQHQLLPDSTDDSLTANLDILDTSEDLSSTTFIKKIDSNIKELEKDTSTKDLDLEAMENLDKTDESTKQRNTRHNINNEKNIQNTNTKKTRNKGDRAVPSTVHAILNAPTNTMRAYLRSKTGLYLRMGPNGELGGTRQMKDKHGKRNFFFLRIRKKCLADYVI